MRISYWSVSKFADKIRKLFGIQPLPHSLSAEGWKLYEQNSKTKSRIGVALVDSLDTIQDIVCFVPDKIKSCVYYLSNGLKSNHNIRTGLKFGAWSDLTEKIPRGLFTEIIEFIEGECFHMCVVFDSEIDDPIVKKYRAQGYIKRRLFPMHIPTEVRTKYAFIYLDFQVESDPSRKVAYDEIREAYNFAKTYFTHDSFAIVEEQTGQKFDDIIDSFGSTDVFDGGSHELRKMYLLVNEEDIRFEDKVQKHLTSIITHRHYLWT